MSIGIKVFGWRAGNQLFQVAAAASLALDNKVNFLQPEWGYDKFFRLEYETFNENSTPIFHYKEPGFNFTPIPYYGPTEIDGYFQSEKYFKHNEKYIRKIFQRKNVIPDDKISSFILSRNYDDKCTAIHVRRGDYKNYPMHHPLIEMDYYNKAILKLQSSVYFIFSDDIEWCKQNFIGPEFVFIEGNSDIVDFHSMTLCDNLIIGNSTFSWWAAWLCESPNKKVIAPNPHTCWFGPALKHYNMNDLIPEGWVTI